MPTDAIYLRVSSDRQTTRNQFEELVEVARRDGSNRDWGKISQLLDACVTEETRTSPSGRKRVEYKVDESITTQLLQYCIYIDQGKSAKVGAKSRPLFQRMRIDAGMRKFDRILVWKVSRLGRDMREIISVVYDLSDMGIEVMPIKSQTGPISTSMGKLLWAIQAWFAEVENENRVEDIKAGMARAKKDGKHMGRPKKIYDRQKVVDLRADGKSYREIGRELGISRTQVMRDLREGP